MFVEKWLLSILACSMLLTPSFSKFQEREYLPLASDYKKSEEFSEFPRNFRTTSDEIGSPFPSKGLKELNIAGTSQFNEQQLASILNFLRKPVVVIDLREETHLIFEDLSGRQIPITAYASQNAGNVGKSLDEIIVELLCYQTYIRAQESILLHYTDESEVVIETDDPQFFVGNIYTEKEIVERLNQKYMPGVEYVQLPVTDHTNPDPETVDRFLKIFFEVKNKENEAIILFHCKAGRGRTGLFMNMADILQNAVKYDLSFEEIVTRQVLLGSPDYLEVKEGREENSEARNTFLKQFYLFVKSEDGYHAGTSFTEYLILHPR